MTKPTNRLAVIGWGALTPLGATAQETWIALVNGQCGIRAIGESWANDLPTRIAGRVHRYPSDSGENLLEPLLQRRLDRATQLAVLAAREAWGQARNYLNNVDRSRIAVVIGTGIGGLSTLERQHTNLNDAGPSRVTPLTVPMMIPNAAAGQIAIELGIHGGCHTPVSACASGAEALLLAQWLLDDDRADVVIAGGCEAPVNRLGLVGFSAMRALSTRNETPEQASRPYCKDRDGFVLSEGAGVLVLKRERDLAYKEKPLGWLLSCGSSCDGYQMVAPDPDGVQASRAINDALERAEVSAKDLSFIQGHATGTRLGDLAEARALHRALGPALDSLPVTAPKSQLGHLLGAAGAVETILAIQALREGKIPASINAERIDPEVRLNVAQQNVAIDGNSSTGDNGQRFALKNAFGFGGHNISLVLGSAC
ncbi:beta-ketoacyl-[acyl-carrier-protein] synthase family protein [Vulcanococcus sp. Clear-D1]|uniref:beta-ketoacyl-[acyl-carrier-protein] synthase family protein n=1 Tax=Vulcanococcus sp. Clear-D1 TaxID=2766970 RepID=UPI0019C29AC6|nr:beta-ketoacyl-[acyl-carrier-protein] synthase family protein [Vulcanococcus sp. Clear-D1]MBD1195020.1 beta-ketoacyl-[acyl-carrier-protein] synthase family protein [Vulcanococcus sp. Clear-D1]